MSRNFKYAYLLGMIVQLVLGGFSLSSCSSDDDENSASKSVGVLDESTGLRVTSAGGYNYVYQDDGRLQYILSSDHCRYEFSYNPDKIVHVDYDHYEEAQNIAISYNGSGYVSNAIFSEKWEDDDDDGEYGEATLDATFSYDSDGHLSKVSGTYKESEYWDGKSYDTSGTVTYILTWNNNLLQKVVLTHEGRDSDGPSKYVTTYTLTYNNNAMANNANKYLQYASFADYAFDSDFMERLCYVGLLGKGPSFLPSGLEYVGKYEYYTEEGEKRNGDDSGSKTYSYGFNNDGSVSYSYDSYSKESYSYDHVESSSGGGSPFTRATEDAVSSQKHKNHFGLARLHRAYRK